MGLFEAKEGKMCFNPRARRGRDFMSHAYSPITSSFNPRARRGRDLYFQNSGQLSNSFNPRARRGRDVPLRALN